MFLADDFKKASIDSTKRAYSFICSYVPERLSFIFSIGMVCSSISRISFLTCRSNSLYSSLVSSICSAISFKCDAVNRFSKETTPLHCTISKKSIS
ncbi:hypothetical protein KM903_20385 [Bacillus glycinifermentans]|nr:hypothetical protein [Bacillus glycinifermentans]